MTGLYKAGFSDRLASVYVDRDWVTPLWISPQTCSGRFLFDFVPSWWTMDLGPCAGRACLPSCDI